MTDTFERLIDPGVVAVVRGADADDVVHVTEALRDGGVYAIEITADSRNATEMIADVASAFPDGDTIVGAGTVLDSETATDCIAAGAEFVVSPSFSESVVETCNRYGTVVAPGVMTPTEAIEAFEAGADLVKVFPAKTLGPAHLAALTAPLPQIPMLPTGGVTPANAGDYVEAGACAVGAGSSLVDADAVDRGAFDEITANARAFVEAVEGARGE